MTATLLNYLSKEKVQLSLIIIGGLILRLINLATQPYWSDEILTVGIVRQFPNVIELIRYIQTVEIHPPLYYILIHYWSNWFGFDEWIVRMPSVIFGVAAILMMYFLGKALFDNRKVGLFAALLLAVLPLHIDMSQNARPYALFIFSGLAAAYVYWRYRLTNRKIYLPFYIIASMVGVYLHYSFIYILVALSSFWLIDIFRRSASKSREFTRWLIIHALLFVGFYPWLSTVLYKYILRQYTLFTMAAIPLPTVRPVDILGTILNRLFWFIKADAATFVEIAAIWLFKVLGFYFVIRYIVDNLRAGKPWYGQNADALLFALWMSVVMILLYVFTPISVPYTTAYQRHILLSALFIIILFSYLLAYISFKNRLLLLTLFLLSIFTTMISTIGDDSVWDSEYRWQQTADFVNNNFHQGDLVIVENAFWRADIGYFLNDSIPLTSLHPYNYYGYDFMATRNTLGLVENEYQFRYKDSSVPLTFRKLDYLVKIYEPKRVWLLYFSDHMSDMWFINNGWKLQFSSPSPLLPVNILEAPADTKSATEG